MKIASILETRGPDASDPYEQGWRSGFRTDAANPYPAGTPQHAKWQAGRAEREAQPGHYDESVESDMPDLETVGEPVESIMDAEQRLAAGDRIFAAHEMDEEPFEIHNVGDLAGYAYDQLLAVPQGVTEARAASRSTRAGLEKLGKLNAMTPEERKAYNEKQADQVRKREATRAAKWRADQAKKAAKAHANSGEPGVAEGFPHDVDHMPGKTIRHQDTNCTTCHGRKSMYKLGNKLFADNKPGATKVKCPTCKGTGDKPGVAEGFGGYDDEDTMDEYMNLQSGDYVRDTQDSSGEVFIMRGQPDDRRVRIEDKNGSGWNIAPYRLVAVAPEDAAIGHYFNDMNEQDVAEGKDELQTELKTINQQLKDALKEYKKNHQMKPNQYMEKVKKLKDRREELIKQLQQDVAEATSDPKFDNMLKGITGKKAVAKQQKTDTKQQSRDAFGSMFGGTAADLTKNLKIREQGVAEGAERNELDDPRVQAALKKMAERHRSEKYSKEQLAALGRRLAAAGKQKPVKEDITKEDIITKLKARLGDYLSDLSKEIKSDPDLINKLAAHAPDDQMGPPVKTVTTDDGHKISIHGNEADGFRISIKNKQSTSKFKNLDEAVMACEMYCAQRRASAESADYIDEAGNLQVRVCR